MNTIIWDRKWRAATLSQLDQQDWDLIIIGGGITGAGVFRSAVTAGVRALLLDANDFAFGTSSRSSKLVHGGFRYLFNKQYHVTYESVTERERLLREAPCLVTSLAFNLPNYRSYQFPSWIFNIGLGIYDLMGRKWDHRPLPYAQMEKRIPGLSQKGFQKGFRYKDAVLDDARLVFRVVRESVQDGGTAMNYLKAVQFLRDKQKKVCGVIARDMVSEDGATFELRAKAVVNASGPWSDSVREDLNAPEKLRPLRGSHIILPYSRLPVQESVTFFHPRDKRAMFVIPWEGTSMVGTTDIDHADNGFHPDIEPYAAQAEIEYILEGIAFLFPGSEIGQRDIISTFAGLRPVVNTGADTPSKESRAHQVWVENGLVTVSGGKLTTFRIMARDTLEAVGRAAGQRIRVNQNLPMLKPVCHSKQPAGMSAVEQRLIGRSGVEASHILRQYRGANLARINGLPAIWAELKFAAKAEAVQHLDDLLLRRTRIGMLIPEGGREMMADIRLAVQQDLGWSNDRWQKERRRYEQIWEKAYSPRPG